MLNGVKPTGVKATSPSDPAIDVPVIVIGLMADGTQRCAIRPPDGSCTVSQLAMLLAIAMAHIMSSQMRSGVDPNEAMDALLGMVRVHLADVVDAWLAGESGPIRP